MASVSQRSLSAARFALAVTTIACIGALTIYVRYGASARRPHVEFIRRDQLAVLSLDNGRTRVLYTSSLLGRGAVGYHELGPLLVFANDEVQAGSGFNMHAHENVDVLTVVLQGSLDQEDTAGHRARVNVGEAALMSAGTGVKHAEFANRDEITRSVTIWFRPRTMGKTPSHTTAKPVEKGGWELIAAEHDAPLTLEQDARVSMKRLAAQEKLPLVVQPARLLYVAAVDGELVAGDQRLSVPERIILRSGTMSIRSDTGATIVIVDVPSPER